MISKENYRVFGSQRCKSYKFDFEKNDACDLWRKCWIEIRKSTRVRD